MAPNDLRSAIVNGKLPDQIGAVESVKAASDIVRRVFFSGREVNLP